MMFWFFLFFCSLLMPATFLGVGWYFTRHTPGRNSAFGYRTPLSGKSDLANAFAHQYIGRLLVLQLDKDTTGWIGDGLVLLECGVMLLTILPTEVALHKNFDKDGAPRAGEE